MTQSFTTIHTVITKAAAEAGIRDNEEYKVNIIDRNSDLLEFELITEWTVVTCYADLESTRILGLMSEAKPVEALLDEMVTARGRAISPLRAA